MEGEGIRGATSPRRGQGGYSLIEVLIAVFLVGTVILALAVGMLTMMRSTRVTSEQQRLEAGLLSYTEWLRSQDYIACAGAGSYPAWPGMPGVEGAIDRVRYWQRDPGEPWTGGEGPFGNGCAEDRGRQLLDVTVELPGGPSTTGQIVLRRDA